MDKVNNNPALQQGSPAVSAAKSKKSEALEIDQSFKGMPEMVKELELTNDPAAQALVGADNLDQDLAFLSKNPEAVKRALEFADLSEKDNSFEQSSALMGAYVKEFEQG